MTPAKAIGIDIIPVKDSDLADSCDAWITFISIRLCLSQTLYITHHIHKHSTSVCHGDNQSSR